MTALIYLKLFSRLSEVFCQEKWFLVLSLTLIRWKLCCTDLSLRRDPDRQSAIVPPLIHKLGLIVRHLLASGCVKIHVVDYPMILNVAAYRRESLSVCLHSLFIA